jgi:ectoine hydroxylase-related dioxygenase (phytanoyl-CoA dioxygenase family)
MGTMQSPTMTIGEAAAALGCAPEIPSTQEQEKLDRDGYLAIPNVLAAPQIDAIRRRLDELLDAEGEAAGLEVHQEAGTERLANLVDKGEEFEVFFTHPKVLSAVAHVLQGDLKLSSLNARFALPGQGLQGLHADWGRLETPGQYQVCNSIWLLDDFTPENGATRAVPGSHANGNRLPSDEMKDVRDTHPSEILLLGKAGDVVVFNSHTWHGGTLNRTDARRRACHSYFCRREQPQQLDQRKHLRLETVARLSPAARVVLDVG